VNDLIAGRTEHEAVEHFERENRMAERAGPLSREGTLFASWLFATEGIAATTFENRVAFAARMKDFGMAAPVIVAGIENAVAATVILAPPDALFSRPSSCSSVTVGSRIGARIIAQAFESSAERSPGPPHEARLMPRETSESSIGRYDSKTGRWPQ